MRTITYWSIVLALLAAAGCAGMSDIRNLPLDKGSPMTVDASADVVKQAARASLNKGQCDVEEESQVDERTTIIIGLTGMNILTLAPTSGIWCRYVIRKVEEHKTAVHFYTQIRDPFDAFAKQSIFSVDSNIATYFSAYVEEFADQAPARPPAAKHP